MRGTNIDKIIALASPTDSIIETINKIAKKDVAYYGIAVVVDSEYHVLGVINDGDIIRLISKNTDLSTAVGSVMIKDPIVIHVNLSHEEIIQEVQRQLRKRNKHYNKRVRYVLIVDDDARLVNVIRYADLLSVYKRFGEKVAIFGQGYVGVTLSAALSNRGHIVTGIDIDKDLVANLSKGKTFVHEPGLDDMINSSLERGVLKFQTPEEHVDANVFIIAVGTPVLSTGAADLKSLISASKSVSKFLKRGDLVMLRSTVPVGITKDVVLPILEENSKLKAGHDFYLAFTPERTAEGNAMRELVKLPQIVGGLTAVCTQKASLFWGTLTDSVVHVIGLEAAELIKLINNSFRDLSFAYSNAIALVCDKLNINAFHLIDAANEGYIRNKIPQPSPGVGGYCLTKDPYLYSFFHNKMGHSELAKIGRNINECAAAYPVEIIKRYIDRNNSHFADLKVFIIGFAFKGWPETNDLRNSSSLDTAFLLKNHGSIIFGWDAVIKPEFLLAKGIKPIEIEDGCRMADAILILNNHPANIIDGFISSLKDKKVLIFDGWGMLDPKHVEQYSGLTYSTMGYITPQKL